MLRCQCIVFDPELMISHLKWIVMNLCYTGLQKLAFNLSNPSYSSLSLTEGSCTAEGFSESYSISANSGIQCVDERVTAPRVKCLFVFFYPVCAGVCVCVLSKPNSFYLYPQGFIHLHPRKPKWQNCVIILKACVKNAAFVAPTWLIARENCDLSVSWKGGWYRQLIEFFQFSLTAPDVLPSFTNGGTYL